MTSITVLRPARAPAFTILLPQATPVSRMASDTGAPTLRRG